MAYIDIELSEFSDEDIMDEYEYRNLRSNLGYNSTELLNTIWLKRRLNQDFDAELDQLIYNSLGKIL